MFRIWIMLPDNSKAIRNSHLVSIQDRNKTFSLKNRLHLSIFPENMGWNGVCSITTANKNY